MALRMTYHGGANCGIKIIRGFEYPNYPEFKLNITKFDFPDRVSYVYPDRDNFFFFGKAPNETQVERLDRFLFFLDAHRPGGLCEVTLTMVQNMVWSSILEQRNFKMVTEFVNPNSMSRIFIYHRISPEKKPVSNKTSSTNFPVPQL